MTIELNPVGIKCNLACEYCLPAGTPVLMADGSWKAIEEVEVGDEIVGFDEHRPGAGKHRRLRTARVTATMSRVVDGVRILTDRGEIVSSDDHRWLSGHGRWRHARKLRVGDDIKWTGPHVQPPAFDEDYKAGYFAAVSIGDAMVGHWPSWTYTSPVSGDQRTYVQHRYRLALNDSEILDRTHEYATALGIPLHRQEIDLGKSGRCDALQISMESAVGLIEDLMADDRDTDEWAKGFVAGFFDAEGSIDRGCGTLRISQRIGPAIDRVQAYIERFGFRVARDREKENGVVSIRILGGFAEVVRFWGTFRPAAKGKLNFDGAPLRGRARILDFDRVPATRMYDLTTTTGTFIAAGFASHNCYETEMREAGNYGPRDYDFDRMQQGLLAEIGRPTGGSWTLHGGEPFLMPIEDVERMWAWGRARGHSLGVQTNGALITDRHIELAKKYSVHIGISIDGPGSMNDLRSRGTLEKTREATAASEQAIERLCSAGVSTSVIVVLHKLNMDPARRDEFKVWIRHLDQIGVAGVRFHPMEMDAKARDHAPAIEDYVEFYRDMTSFMSGLQRLRIDVIQDIRRLMRGDDDYATCTWHSCDPYTTAAVQGVDGQGNRTNCGRTQKDGVMAPKADRAGFERYVALYHTPQEYGGCQGCRFFAACKGQCPGEGIAGDWRNRSMYCGLYTALFEDEEMRMRTRGEIPVSLAPDRQAIERLMVDHWSRGRRVSIAGARRILAGQASPIDGTGDSHADQPHGDWHGDHTDAARLN